MGAFHVLKGVGLHRADAPAVNFDVENSVALVRGDGEGFISALTDADIAAWCDRAASSGSCLDGVIAVAAAASAGIRPVGVDGDICMEYGIRRDLCAAALFGVPAVEAVTAASGGAGQRGQLLIGGGHAADRGRTAVAVKSDGVLRNDLILHRQRAVDPVERIPLVPAGFEGGSGNNGVGSGGIACRFCRDFLVVRVKQPIGKGVVQHRIPVVRASFAVQQAGAAHKACWQRIALGDGCAACRHGETSHNDRATGDNRTAAPWRPRRRGIGHIENVNKGLARLDCSILDSIERLPWIAGRINRFLINFKDPLLSHNR